MVLGMSLTRLCRILGSVGCAFISEDVWVPGQHELQQHRYIALQLITAQTVLQLSRENITRMLYITTNSFNQNKDRET